jgi:hypothetical protein
MAWSRAVDGSRKGSGETASELSSRIEAEYMEMPGLNVTLKQAQRLWTADPHTCQAVFDALVARGVVRVTTKGRFIRA